MNQRPDGLYTTINYIIIKYVDNIFIGYLGDNRVDQDNKPRIMFAFVINIPHSDVIIDKLTSSLNIFNEINLSKKIIPRGYVLFQIIEIFRIYSKMTQLISENVEC